MATLTAVYDACVLYPAPLRDLLMRLALTDLFRARWTATIHDEWTRNLLRTRPDLTPEQVRRTRDLMDAHVPDALVIGYEPLIDTLALPDPDDRHVLAAAIRAEAGVIVTFNLSDFPPAALAPFGVAAQHPDAFVRHLIDVDADVVAQVVRGQHASLRRPPVTMEHLLDVLEKQT